MSSPFSSPAISPEANASEQSRKELQDRLNGLGGINGRRLDPETKAKKLREACEGFESIFIQKMWQEMRNAVPKSGLMQGREERYWQDMYDQELAKSMTQAGGIGLADMMYEQLSRNLGNASRSAASMDYSAVFTPAAAPLVTEAQYPDEMPGQNADTSARVSATQTAEAADRKATPSIYDGEAPQTADAPAGTAAALAAEQNAAPQLAAQAGVNMAASTTPKEKPVRQKKQVIRSSGNSAIEQAYIARRDAGDKLGSRAVRPALRSRKEARAAEARQAAETMQQPVQTPAAPKPGSPEALRAAMDLAKTGAPAQAAVTPESLNAMVADLRARNNAASPNAQTAAPTVTAQANMQPQEAQSAAQTEQPDTVVRKVRYTTNIPKHEKAGKKNSQPIRMLNADNVGINSRAGQGLAAYHAAQQQAAATVPQASTSNPGQNAQPAAVSTGIAPLTPKNIENSTTNDSANFAIPPLTAGDLRS